MVVGEAGGSAVVASVDGSEVVASVGGCAVECGAVARRYRKLHFIMKTSILGFPYPLDLIKMLYELVY